MYGGWNRTIRYKSTLVVVVVVFWFYCCRSSSSITSTEAWTPPSSQGPAQPLIIAIKKNCRYFNNNKYHLHTSSSNPLFVNWWSTNWALRRACRSTPTSSSSARRSSSTCRYSKNADHSTNDDSKEEKSSSVSSSSPPPTSPSTMNDGESSSSSSSIGSSRMILLSSRFISPTIDDPGLPLSDILIAQIVAPTIQVWWLSIYHAPTPSWLQPILMNRPMAGPGSLLAPTLIHGAALALCWILGALAAKAYERSAISPIRVLVINQQQPIRNDNEESDKTTMNNDNNNLFPFLQPASSKQLQQQSQPTQTGYYYDYGKVIESIIKAGAFAIGLLIASTQLDLLWEFHGHLVQYGDSPETDLRITVAMVEVMNDIVFEAICLFSWRWILAQQTERMKL